MHPDAFQELIEDVGKWAIQNPDDTDQMEKLITLQYVALDRSDKFQQSWQETINRLPVLNPAAQRPSTKTATLIELSSRQEDRNMYVAEMRETMGILVFSKKGCPYCEKQRSIILEFTEKWQWKNIIEMDIEENPDAAVEYSVSVVPDIFLVANLPDGEIVRHRLNAGLTTQDDILRGLLNAYSVG